MTLKVTYETVESPDGYPKEFKAIKGKPRTKRERHVYAAHARAVKEAQDDLIEMIEDCGCSVERVE